MNDIGFFILNHITNVLKRFVSGVIGAGGGNRTRVTSLEGWGFTPKLRPLNMDRVGFEPT